jgi:hypothetical protein
MATTGQLADALVTETKGSLGMGIRLANITSVGDPGNVTVRFPEDSISVPARHLGSYSPVIGDPVQVLVNWPDVLVLGSPVRGQDVGPPRDYTLDPIGEDEIEESLLPRDFVVNPLLNEELANDAVMRRNILDGAINRVKIAEAAINAALIDAGAVTETKIANNAISTPKIQANSIVSDHIQARQVDAFHVVAGSLTANEIAARTITADRISVNTLTSNEIRTETIAADQAFLTNLTVGTAQIADGAITTAKIGNAQIRDAQIHSLSASKINAGFLSASRIQGGTIDASLINVINLNASAITAGTFSANRISGGTINANLIDVINLSASNIVSGTLSASRIGSGTISASISISSPTINGGTITAANFRTRSSGARVWINGNTDAILFYNSSGQSTSLRQGNSDGIEFSGSIRVGGSLGNRVVYCGEVRLYHSSRNWSLNTLSNTFVLRQDAGGSWHNSWHFSWGSTARFWAGGSGAHLGSTTYRFGILYASSVNTTSDARSKKGIIELTPSIGRTLGKMLTPRRFHRVNECEEDPEHFGFVYQEVKEALLAAGVNPACVIDPVQETEPIKYYDSEGRIEREVDPPEAYGGIDYNELLPILWAWVADIDARLPGGPSHGS